MKHGQGNLTYFVRLTGTKRERYVEFEFAINEPELAVELVMPFDEFMEFCRRYRVTFLTPDPKAAAAFDRLSDHLGAPDGGRLESQRIQQGR